MCAYTWWTFDPSEPMLWTFMEHQAWYVGGEIHTPAFMISQQAVSTAEPSFQALEI